jgi:glutaredoxin-like protein NrdH
MITVYSKTNCPQCVVAKNKLNAAGISFVEVRVDFDAAARVMLMEAGHRSVPVLYKDGLHVQLDKLIQGE